MNGIKRQTEYLKALIDVIDTPVYFTRNRRNKAGKFVPGKRWEFGKVVPPLDHRTIGSNEVVLELDAKTYSQNYKYAIEIIDYLISAKIPYYTFWSGNKSVHIHIFLDIQITEGLKEEVKKVLEHGCNLYQEIRMKMAREIIAEAGLSERLIGQGNVVDLAKLKWDDINGKTSLIRCCGGANIKVIERKVNTAWKDYYKELPKNKPRPTNSHSLMFDAVSYPELPLQKHKVSEGFIAECIEEYFVKLTPKLKKELKTINFEGKFMNVPCIQKLLEDGLPVGKRNIGAKVLAIGARMDGLLIPEAKELLIRYVQSCPQYPQPFEQDEAEMWLEWIYEQPNPYWTCAHARSVGICDKHNCSYQAEKFKDEIAFFDVDQPLGHIKKVLDQLIVGEDELKMQLFLLYLTKEFEPEWCIMLDGPAASGKSHIMKKVAMLFGEEEEEYFCYSRLTQASLNHMDVLADKWARKVVIIEELQGAKNVVEQLRVAISEGKLTLLEAKEVNESGVKSFVTEAKEIKFDNVLFVTCNAEEFDEGEQLKSRAWILNTDQTRDQTSRIIDYYLDDFNYRINEMPLLDRISLGLKVLVKPDRVVFPFANEIKEYISTSSVRGRRDVKKLISLIKASAYFHQKRRKWIHRDGQKILIADWRDVYTAYNYAGDSLNASTQGVGSKDLKYYEKIVTHLVHQDSFQVDDVCSWCGLNLSGAQKLLINLCEAGFFENIVKPPMKATYMKTKINPEYVGDVKVFCAEKARMQDEKLDEWVKENETE